MSASIGLLLGLSLAVSDPLVHEGCFGFHAHGHAEVPTDFVQLARAERQEKRGLVEPKDEGGPPINFGMSGAWYEPKTSGQGFLIDVIPGRQLLNVAWFTHAATQTSDDVNVQRWLFGTGSYTGDSVQMPLTLSRGGRFDAPPVLTPVEVGSLTLRFVDCNTAVAEYVVFESAIRGGTDPVAGEVLSGSIELLRIGESSVCEQLAASFSERMMAIRGVNLLPMDSDRVIEDQTVLVHSGQIVAVGPTASVPLPFGTLVIEGRGRWLMPGLIDGHTHEIPLGYWPRDTAGNLLMYLANGITSIVNMGDVTGIPIGIAGEVERGETPGPTMYIGHFARGAADGGSLSIFARNPDEARRLAQRAAAGGYDFIKSYSRISRPVFDVLVAEGGRNGLPVVGHVSLDFPYLEAIQNGQRMAVHSSDVWAFGFNASFNAAAIPAQAAQLRSHGVALGTTLAVIELIKDLGLDALAGRNLFDRVLAREGIEYMDDRAISAWRRMFDERPDIQTPRDLSAALAFMQQLVKGFDDAGVVVLPGADTIGIPGMVPGFSLQRELELMHAGGMSRFAVLKSASRTQAQFIEQQFRGHVDRIGVIEPGARADLLLLDADPRADLRTLRRPAGVMARGNWYSGEWLRAQLKWLRNNR